MYQNVIVVTKVKSFVSKKFETNSQKFYKRNLILIPLYFLVYFNYSEGLDRSLFCHKINVSFISLIIYKFYFQFYYVRTCCFVQKFEILIFIIFRFNLISSNFLLVLFNFNLVLQKKIKIEKLWRDLDGSVVFFTIMAVLWSCLSLFEK